MADQDISQELSAEREDALLQEVFTDARKRQDPPRAKLDRWEALFRAELGHKVLARKQRRLYIGAGVAVIAMLVGVAQFMVPQAPDAPIVATVVADKNGNKLYSSREVFPVHPGLEIKVGDALHTGQNGNLALTYRDADIRLRGDTAVRFHAAKLELMHGAVYVDTHQRSSATPKAVVVSTDHGSFTHTGTQFLVQTNEQEVVAAVREGSIIASNQAEPLAAAHGAQQIRITADGEVVRQAIPRNGGVWEWVVDAAPGFDAPNAKIHDVLYWATRELGLDLHYVTADARNFSKANDLPAKGLTVDRVIGIVERVAPSVHIEQTPSQWLVAIK